MALRQAENLSSDIVSVERGLEANTIAPPFDAEDCKKILLESFKNNPCELMQPSVLVHDTLEKIMLFTKMSATPKDWITGLKLKMLTNEHEVTEQVES